MSLCILITIQNTAGGANTEESVNLYEWEKLAICSIVCPFSVAEQLLNLRLLEKWFLYRRRVGLIFKGHSILLI